MCTITSGAIATRVTSVTFTVTNLSLSGYTYSPLANHDPETDSNGTTIIIRRP